MKLQIEPSDPPMYSINGEWIEGGWAAYLRVKALYGEDALPGWQEITRYGENRRRFVLVGVEQERGE